MGRSLLTSTLSLHGHDKPSETVLNGFPCPPPSHPRDCQYLYLRFETAIRAGSHFAVRTVTFAELARRGIIERSFFKNRSVPNRAIDRRMIDLVNLDETSAASPFLFISLLYCLS